MDKGRPAGGIMNASAQALHRAARRWGMIVGLAIGIAAAPTMARAQSAIIYGSLGNFDISNDTGKVCHGFEIQLEGLAPAQVPYSFGSASS